MPEHREHVRPFTRCQVGGEPACPGPARPVAEDRARHLARLAYNLIQAGRPDEARSLVAETRAEIDSGDETSRLILQLADGALLYVDGHFDQSLRTHEAVMRQGFGTGEATRERVAYQWRCELLAVVDRLDESLQLLAEGIASAQHDRQGWALDFFETWRGRQLFQRGRLSDAAAALEGRFDPEDAHNVVGALYAAGVVALGRVAIHSDDERRKRATAEIAKVMMETGTPANRRHGAWLLALQAMANSDPSGAKHWLVTLPTERPSILPLYPMDVTDEPHLVRIGLACDDVRLAADAVAVAERRARGAPNVASVKGAASHARGLLDDDIGRLAQAAKYLEQGERPLAVASALEDLGNAHIVSTRATQAWMPSDERWCSTPKPGRPGTQAESDADSAPTVSAAVSSRQSAPRRDGRRSPSPSSQSCGSSPKDSPTGRRPSTYSSHPTPSTVTSVTLSPSSGSTPASNWHASSPSTTPGASRTPSSWNQPVPRRSGRRHPRSQLKSPRKP